MFHLYTMFKQHALKALLLAAFLAMANLSGIPIPLPPYTYRTTILLSAVAALAAAVYVGYRSLVERTDHAQNWTEDEL